MFVKCFSTSKRGEGKHAIEDSISVDLQRGRFAVSDGVSRSFLPKIWSNILTQAWVSVDLIEDFPSNEIFVQFRQERDRIFKLLDEDTRMDYEDLEERYQTASATFCGVEVHHGKLKWVIIGDSCLFLLPEGEHPLCISSHPMPTDNDGYISSFFDNTPYQVLANGEIHGEWTRGERTFEKGVFLLMSDAMSEWFINVHNNGNNPLDQLLALTDDDAFEQWVDEQYNLGLLKSDDESVIIVQLDEAIQEEWVVSKTNTVSTEENALLTVDSPNVSEEIKTVTDDNSSVQLIGETSNLDLLKSKDEDVTFVHVDEIIQEKEIVDNKNFESNKENVLFTVEPPDVSGGLMENNKTIDENITERFVKKKRKSICKKINWFKFVSFFRLLRNKNTKIK